MHLRGLRSLGTNTRLTPCQRGNLCSSLLARFNLRGAIPAGCRPTTSFNYPLLVRAQIENFWFAFTPVFLANRGVIDFSLTEMRPTTRWTNIEFHWRRGLEAQSLVQK